MATTHTDEKHNTPHAPPPVPTEVKDRPARETMRDEYMRKQQEEADRFDVADKLAYERATRGCINDDIRDRVLAMGGDATRSSPDPSQPLDDAVPGLTTTTGVHRTPMDPTTAAVPAPANSPMVERMRGAPSIGSGGKSGVAEVLWQAPDEARRRIEPAPAASVSHK